MKNSVYRAFHNAKLSYQQKFDQIIMKEKAKENSTTLENNPPVIKTQKGVDPKEMYLFK